MCTVLLGPPPPQPSLSKDPVYTRSASKPTTPVNTVAALVDTPTLHILPHAPFLPHSFPLPRFVYERLSCLRQTMVEYVLCILWLQDCTNFVRAVIF